MHEGIPMTPFSHFCSPQLQSKWSALAAGHPVARMCLLLRLHGNPRAQRPRNHLIELNLHLPQTEGRNHSMNSPTVGAVSSSALHTKEC